MAALLRVTRDQARSLLEGAIVAYSEIRLLPVNTAEDRRALLAAYRNWDERNKRLLDYLFTSVSWHETSPKNNYAIASELKFLTVESLSSEQAPELGVLGDEKVRALQSIVDSLDLFEVEPSVADDPTEDSEENQPSETIFIVHGRDVAALELTRRFLEQCTTITPTVLSEQANQGRTLIEELEFSVPPSSFVVIIMTADDVGGLQGEEQRPRARQNVILELGFAMGRVGRSRTACLVEETIEPPSDYSGMVYITFDGGGGWRIQLAKELRAAGIDVDMNRLT